MREQNNDVLVSAKLILNIPVWLDRIFTVPLLVYRLLRYGYTFRKIFLGRDSSGKDIFTILDPEDYYRYVGFNWYAYGHINKLYAVRNIEVNGKLRAQRLHRLIMNAPNSVIVDHKNCESLDNRQANLRHATLSQNMQNRKKRKNTSSQYIGVWFIKATGKWESRIKHNGKSIFLGKFKNEIDAAKAYDLTAFKLRGEFARLNFPRENYINKICPMVSK